MSDQSKLERWVVGWNGSFDEEGNTWMRKEFISKTVEVKQNDCFEMYIIIFEYHRSVSIVFFFFFSKIPFLNLLEGNLFQAARWYEWYCWTNSWLGKSKLIIGWDDINRKIPSKFYIYIIFYSLSILSFFDDFYCILLNDTLLYCVAMHRTPAVSLAHENDF